MKTCAKCRLDKDETEFGFKSYIRKDGTRGREARCETCVKAYQREFFKRYHQTPRGKEVALRSRLKRNYSLTPKQREDMAAGQDGKCANDGCQNPATCVDHDHVTGAVRAMLCLGCNTSLGQLGDGYDNDKIAGLLRYAVKHAPAEQRKAA